MKTKPVLLRSLAALNTLPIQVKPKKQIKQMCEAHTKPQTDGTEEWVRFKSECVLLTGKGKAK